ncbi:MAG: DUF2330 domain-containing protein [Elusimicrobiota bacterium]|nr:DUF2330 domain-containing protein [Elusimicrobiota bacterium]
MKICSAPLIAAFLFFLPTRAVYADGVMWPAANAHDLVPEQAQRAWVEWSDGSERLTVAVMPGAVQPKLAWILPVPAPAGQARLKLVDSLPDWKGKEVRAEARLAFSPGVVLFLFAGCILLSSVYELAVVLGIILLLSGIAIGPGPIVSRVEEAGVKAFAHAELGGLTSELVEAPSLDALKKYLKSKSCALPAPAAGFIEEHIKKGHSFVISWARAEKIEKALAVEVDFQSAAPWYPVRLTSAYGKAELEIDLTLSGWQELVSAPGGIKTGYYSGRGAPGKYTRILYKGKAADLQEDWTFAPKKRAALKLAEMTAAQPFLVNFIFLVWCSIAGTFIVGLIAFPDWRCRAGILPLLEVGLAGIVPVYWPSLALRRLRPAPAVEPPQLQPQAMRVLWPAAAEHGLKYLWGIALVCTGTGFLFWALDGGISGLVRASLGIVLCAAGGGLFQFYRGHPRGYIIAGALFALLPFIGPFLALLMRPGPVSAPRKPKPFLAQARLIALACMLLYIFLGAWLLSFWSIKNSTAVIKFGRANVQGDF